MNTPMLNKASIINAIKCLPSMEPLLPPYMNDTVVCVVGGYCLLIYMAD